MDILIKNGTVVDGTGRAPYSADVLIQRDTIAHIGSLEGARAKTVIDAAGLCVTPGFIDCHTHSELDLMVNRQHPCAVYSGVSTVVGGQCGVGFAPMAPELFDLCLRTHAGLFGDKRAHLAPWSSFSEFLSRLDGCAVNAAACVTHNAVRQAGTGLSAAPLTGGALEKAKDALDLALCEGAAGFSIGLAYYPGGYADEAELIELCRVAARRGAPLCVHLRPSLFGSSFDPLAEIAGVVRETGVRLHMLHYKTAYPKTVGHPEEMFAPFESLLKEGAAITFEFYPYLAGSSYLLMLLPGWAQEGGADEILSRLASPACRERLIEDIQKRYAVFVPEWGGSVISAARDPFSPCLGRTLEDIAAERGLSVPEAVIALLLENELEIAYHDTEPEDEAVRARLFDDQRVLFSDSRYTIGSDTIPNGEYRHPRGFGTYPRILRLSREWGMPLEKTVHKLTAFPAELYGLKDRGTLEKGKRADICVFDPEKVADRATFDSPLTPPEGIRTLIVGGKPVLRDGFLTGLLPGRALKARQG